MRGLRCAPLIHLLDVPTARTTTPSRILSRLHKLRLPRSRPVPCLRIGIGLDRPRPVLQRRIRRVLRNGPIQLTHVISFCQRRTRKDIRRRILATKLRRVGPLRVIGTAFRGDCRTRVPRRLMGLFRRTYQAVGLR